MLMEFLWKFFERTGDIDSYIFFKQIEHRMDQLTKSTEEEGVAASS